MTPLDQTPRSGEPRPLLWTPPAPAPAPAPLPLPDLLLSEAFGRWARATECRTTTQRSYARCIRKAIGYGLAFVSDMTRPRLGAYLLAMKERKLHPRTIALHLAALIAVLSQLELEGLYPLAELDGLRRLKPKDRTQRGYGMARFLTRPEAERLAVAAAWIVPRLELPVRVALLTGARPGELARMRREDFLLDDPRGPHLRITNLPEWGEAGSAKTGERHVSVCRELRELVVDRCPRSGWLFPAMTHHKGGRNRVTPFIGRWTLEHEITFARRAAGLPEDVTFTVLRHTRASWWLQADPPMSIYDVAAQLGHQVRVCEQHYAGILPYNPACERMPA